jgi:succinate dehydrogenase / fumarate reductase cytochrome b subunit
MHRISGAAIALYGMAHLVVISYGLAGGRAFDRIMELFQTPLFLALELLLLAAVIYHMLNGLRIILFDLGVGIRRQKPLFWGLMGLGAVAMTLAVAALWPFLLGQPLR